MERIKRLKFSSGSYSLLLGYTLAVLGSASYGLNPLFALPLYDIGVSPMNVLFYRYIISALLMGFWIIIRKGSFRLTMKEAMLTFVMGLMFAASSVSLFYSFKFIDAGLASVILFTYPLFVALLSWLVFHEHMSRGTFLCIVVALFGICLLDQGSTSGGINITGMSLAVLSGLTYAFYLIGANRSVMKTMDASKLSFYTLFFGTIMFFIANDFGQDLIILPNAKAWSDAFGLSIFPTIISLVLITRAIHLIGSTPTSIIGALEPITALFISLTVFGGVLTGMNIVGIMMILGAVVFMIYSNNKRAKTA